MKKRGGQPGNKGGGRKTIREEVADVAFGIYILDLIDKNKIPIGKALIKQATKGNVQALKEILERKMGKISQPVDVKETKKLIILDG